MTRVAGLPGVLVSLLLFAGASSAFAQGTTGSINGTITDNTGAVLPGATVTVSGPAIMGVQTNTTNEQGQYRFPSLPPGTFRVQYELSGFNTVVREGIVVNIGFTATVNVQLQVATLTETVTVTGASPVVDTQNSNVQTNFTLEIIKSIPNARDIWALIAVAPGTTMNSFDVGGSRAGTQTGYSAYGRNDQVRVQVDGANATEDTGGTGYFNYGAFEEVQIGTDSNDASMPTPGVQINAVVRSGGNDFRGDLYVDLMTSKMQGKNVTDELQRKGVGQGDRITRYYDPNIGIGGPIKRDKFWYFVSLRDQRSGRTVSGFPADSPAPLDFLTKLENFTDKITYQLNQNHKLSQFFEIRRKLQPLRDASSTRYEDAVYKQESMSSYGSIHWDAVMTRNYFFTARFGSWGYNWPNYAYGTGGLQDNPQNRRSERLTGNLAGAAREDKTHRRRWQVDWNSTLFKDDFLGGNHTLRFGVTLERETERYTDNGFANEYTMQFDSPTGSTSDFIRPWRVQLENSPRLTINNLQHHGAFVQDQIILSRKLTANVGFRWDYYHVYYPELDIREAPFRDFFYAGKPLPNGYSIPASFPSFVIPANPDVLTFPAGFAPRFGVAYDIAGNGKTVLKANWGRYQANPGPQNFVNPMQRITYTFEWLDGNDDRLFTLNELGNFVTSTGGAFDTINPNLKQEYTDDLSVFVEREIVADLGVRVGYVKKFAGNNWEDVQVGRTYGGYTDRRTFADNGPDGLAGTADDGPPIIAFDYPAGVTIPASRNDLRNWPEEESWDQNVDLTINKRMSNRWSLLSSFLYNWAHDVRGPENPNDERFKEHNVTNWAFKLFGTVQAPWEITLNPVMRYQAGENLQRTVQVTLRTGTLDYEAEIEGAYRSDNVSIFDISAERRFRFGGSRYVDAFVAAFNVFNNNAATGMDEIVGTRTAILPTGERVPYARFLRPTAILQPRVFRIGAKLSF
jgi:carboxypeptidase family protein